MSGLLQSARRAVRVALVVSASSAPFALASTSACVPSSEANADPRGAAGARFRPTAVAQGTAFTTSDGWTVTVERIAIVALLATAGRDNVGGSRFVIWDGRAHERDVHTVIAGR